MGRKFFQYFGLAAILVFVLLLFIAPEPTVTGRVNFDVSLKHNLGEKILGDLKFHIKEGELVPKDSLVLIDYVGRSKSFLLSELVFDRPIKGKFYAEGTKLTGEGLGYGVKGSKIVYPSIGFTLKISDSGMSSSSKNSQPKSGAPVRSSGSGGGPSYSPAPSPSEPAPSAGLESSPASSDDASGPGLTAASINENSYKIKGTTAYGEVFEYALESGQTAQLVKGSVTFNGKPLPDNSISVELKGASVIVSTNYFASEEKFGKDFLGDYSLTLSIDVDSLDLYAEEGVLNIKLVHDGITIASHSRLVSITASSAEKSISLLREIPTIRIYPNGEYTFNLSQYFDGAESYAIELSNIDVIIRNNEIVFRPEAGFKGVRRAKVVAYAGENKLESNEFAILVSSGAIAIKTSKDRIEVGKPVRWVKNVKFDSPDRLVIDIPDGATDISVTKMTEASSESVFESIGSGALTGQVSIELDINKRGSFTQWVKRVARRFAGKVTGNALEDTNIDSAFNDVTLPPDASGYTIEYYTLGPEAFEEETENGKRVTISGPDNILYEDVVASATLDESREIRDASGIKLYWRTTEPVVSAELKDVEEVLEHEVVEELSVDENVLSPVSSSESVVSTAGELQQFKSVAVPFDAYDLDGNGYLDYIEWVVPHLSNQTYEIILIVRADHLDENRTFISDIYPEVKALDGDWSETIPLGHYARVTFEINLTSDRDITIYPRTIAGTPRVEVYENNGTEIIARFDNLIDNSYNKIYLTNLTHSQDVFDLRVINGDVQFDYIVDPQAGPGETVELRARACNLEEQSGSNSYNLACAGSYPATCGAGSADRLSCNDGNVESTTYSGMLYGGVNITSFNSTVTDCSSVSNVKLCYEWWVDSINQITNCVIAVDANAGASYSTVTSTCPSAVANPGVTCVDVSALENWACGNFFGPSLGTRAVARSEVSTLAEEFHTLNLDAFYFNVTYAQSDSLVPNISFVSPTETDKSYVARNYILVNVTAADANLQAIAVRLYNSSHSQINSSTTLSSPNFINFSGLAEGVYYFNASANDSSGNSNATATREIIIDTTRPLISFGAATENSGEVLANASLFVNISLTESNFANITFSLYNSLGVFNRTAFATQTTSFSWTRIPAGVYTYEVNATDSANNKNGTGSRRITLVDSCLVSCAEGSACALTNTNCYLSSGMCSGNICDFVNLTIQNSTIYTLYNASNDANSLAINISSNSSTSVRFPSASSFIFWGKNGTSFSGGGRGGHAGVVNITTAGLFNRTNSKFFGIGGYSTLAGVGGNGGILQLNYHGLLGTAFASRNTNAGSSANSLSGSAGSLALVKDGACPLDPDITNDGIVNFNDGDSITENLYGVPSTNSSFVPGYDVICDDILNVIDLSRIGFQFGRR